METVESGLAVFDTGIVQSIPGFVYAHSDNRAHPIGLITLDVKCAGARSARNSPATCDVADVGDGITETSNRARRRKRWISRQAKLGGGGSHVS